MERTGTGQSSHSSTATSPRLGDAIADDGMWISNAWSPTSIDQSFHRRPTRLLASRDVPGAGRSSVEHPTSFWETQAERLEHCEMAESDLVDDSLFNSYCNTSPDSIDLQDPMSVTTEYADRRYRMAGDTPRGGEMEKEERLARRQAQNREAQRAHRAKQKSKLSTLESRVKLAESNCRLLEEANQRMEDVLRNLVNDAVKALTAPAQPTRASKRVVDGQRTSWEGEEGDRI